MNPLQSYSSLSAAGQAVRHGEVRGTELVRALLQRIDESDSSLHAWVAVDRDAAIRQAEHLDSLPSDEKPKLAGITIGVKDIIDVAGYPTLAASPLREDVACQQDAAIVQRLRDAGAIVLGKTVTTQWAFLDPPPTCNPWDLQRTPGGSSSGSAAAVAAQMCHVALGTQTGGSVIRPAAFCGVFGFMFPPGVVSTAGIQPLSPTLDRPGLIAGSLADLHSAYEVLSATDEVSVARSLQPPQQIRVIRAPWFERTDPEVLEVFERAITKLREDSARHDPPSSFEECDLSDEFQGVSTAHLSVMAYEAAIVHRAAFGDSPEQFAPKIAELIQAGQETTDTEYQHALAVLSDWRSAVANLTNDGAILMMPSAPTPPPTAETTGDPSFNSPWTAAGTPVLTAPAGQSADGLPIGIQLITAPAFAERLFRTARCWEGSVVFPALDWE